MVGVLETALRIGDENASLTCTYGSRLPRAGRVGVVNLIPSAGVVHRGEIGRVRLWTAGWASARRGARAVRMASGPGKYECAERAAARSIGAWDGRHLLSFRTIENLAA